MSDSHQEGEEKAGGGKKQTLNPVILGCHHKRCVKSLGLKCLIQLKRLHY